LLLFHLNISVKFTTGNILIGIGKFKDMLFNVDLITVANMKIQDLGGIKHNQCMPYSYNKKFFRSEKNGMHELYDTITHEL
jgi:hypothetical protein